MIESGAGGRNGKRPRDDGWITERDVTLVEGIESLVIPPEHGIDDFLPVHRVLDADANVEIVQGWLANIQIEPTRNFRVAVVESDSLNIPLVDGFHLGLFVPQLRLGKKERVELARTEKLEGLGIVADNGVD